MNIDSLENLNIKRVLERGTGKALVQNERCILVKDEVSGALMLASEDNDEAIKALETNDVVNTQLLVVTNPNLGDLIYEKYGFAGKLECFSMAYLKDEKPIDSGNLSFREATMDDFPFISSEYDLITEDELKEVIEYKNIVLGYTDEGIVGFIGEHLEGSIGLLYILPEYRRRGYASELEKEMFRRTREKGYIPFGQVVTTNDASIKLQESMGLTKSEGTVLWMWR